MFLVVSGIGDTGFFLSTCSPIAGSLGATLTGTTEPASRYTYPPVPDDYPAVIKAGYIHQEPMVTKTAKNLLQKTQSTW
ncbi:MAG: hypothetical protein QXM53_08220 [Thermofilaceae archaeon]